MVNCLHIVGTHLGGWNAMMCWFSFASVTESWHRWRSACCKVRSTAKNISVPEESTRQSLTNTPTECTSLNVGVVQYFVKHTISDIRDYEHVFAYVHWKKKHPQCDWFGSSAIVYIDIDEPLSSKCFIPVQRIACRCAHAVIPVDFNGIVETVFVACPLPIRFCVWNFYFICVYNIKLVITHNKSLKNY